MCSGVYLCVITHKMQISLCRAESMYVKKCSCEMHIAGAKRAVGVDI